MQLPQDSFAASGVTEKELLHGLETDPRTGLSENQVTSRLLLFGKNKIEEEKEAGYLSLMAKQLSEPMIVLLIIIGIIYSVIGNPRDSATIAVIIIIVMFIEAYNVKRARKSMAALRNLTVPKTSVLRNGRIAEISSQNLVPGDIIMLRAGDRVTADSRLLESFGLQLDESALTGESTPVHKDTATIAGPKHISELANMVFAGTFVLQGSGKAVVIATGVSTELGKTSELMRQSEEQKTSLEKDLKSLTVVFASLAISFSFIIPILGVLRGNNIYDMILTGLSMAFATVPEELPIVVTITLAIGAFLLTRKNAIVKTLKAAETLGIVTVIATDKTGTLTENRMTLSSIYLPSRNGEFQNGSNAQFIRTAAFAIGFMNGEEGLLEMKMEPMYAALGEYIKIYLGGTSIQTEPYQKLSEFTFDSKLKLSSMLYRIGEGYEIFTCGAPEVVIGRSNNYVDDEGLSHPLTGEIRTILLEEMNEITSSGKRLLGFAMGKVAKPSSDRNEVERELTFVGIAGFSDPPRKGVKEAIQECKATGIRVIMITGDYPTTAISIAREV
ncbi:MAG: HAD-IC family P-type ATPase, partial [Thermoplasmataceae archaeon]